MKNRVVALITCALGISIIGHIGCTAVDRTYADDTSAGAAGSSGTSGNAGASSGAAGKGAGGATAGAAGSSSGASGASGTSGAGGEAGAPPECVKDNDPCDLDGVNGLCFNGSCTTCIDVTDDAHCSSAYGSGHLCLQGNCAKGNCRANSDCTNAVCLGNTCSKCSKDGDCNDPTLVCNTTSGGCVAAKSSCTGTTDFAACPINASDKCCSGTCGDFQCCAAKDCPDMNTQDCVNGSCQLKSCGTPGNEVWVVPTAASLGSGTQSCPFQTLFAAFNFFRNKTGTFTVHLDGAVTSTTEATQGGSLPLNVPPGVSIVGSGVNMASVTTDVGKGGFTFSSTDTTTHTLSSFTLQQKGYLAMAPSAAEPVGNGVHPSGGTVNVDHMIIEGFDVGLYADAATISVGQGVIVHFNWFGAYVPDGGHFKVAVSTAPATHFDNNVYGVFTSGTSLISMVGADDGTGARLVSADRNFRSGVRIGSSNTGDATIAENRLDFVEMNNNTDASDTSSTYAGLYIYAGAKLLVTNSNFLSNNAAGIRVQQNGTGSMAQIDLGDGTTHGNNKINAGSPDVCIAAPTGVLRLEYDTFNGTPCDGMTTFLKFSPGMDCTGNNRVGLLNGATTASLNVSPCN